MRTMGGLNGSLNFWALEKVAVSVWRSANIIERNFSAQRAWGKAFDELMRVRELVAYTCGTNSSKYVMIDCLLDLAIERGSM